MFLSKIPRIIVFFITYRCNSRCIMCHIWQKQTNSKELSIGEIEKIFSDDLIRSNLEIINITGGEPTLRSDLKDIIKILLRHCHRLKSIDIPTNGINTQEVLDQIEKVLTLLLPTNIRLNVTVSLDGIEGVHENIRRIPGIFKKVNQTIQELKELKMLYPFLSLSLNTVVSKINYKNLNEIRNYALKNDLRINFTLATISEIGVESIKIRDKFEMAENERREVIPFFERLLETKGIDISYGKFILDLLKTGRRNGGCSFRKGKAVLLEPNGNIYMCGNFKEFMLGNVLQDNLLRICQNRKFLKKDWKICRRCESNCYLS